MSIVANYERMVESQLRDLQHNHPSTLEVLIAKSRIGNIEDRAFRGQSNSRHPLFTMGSEISLLKKRNLLETTGQIAPRVKAIVDRLFPAFNRQRRNSDGAIRYEAEEMKAPNPTAGHIPPPVSSFYQVNSTVLLNFSPNITKCYVIPFIRIDP